jgi:transcriptional regulator with XRE-family HTH domain
MAAAQAIREIRRRSGLGLRELARRAGTSHATLHAYATGKKDPRMDTIARLAEAAGLALVIELSPRPDAGDQRQRKARELADALTLAAAFPVRHPARWRAPVFGRAA